MNSESIPQNEYCLVQLPVYLKSDNKLERVVGEKKDFISSVKQGSDISVCVTPDNPFMGHCGMHSKISNKLVLKVVKEGESVNGRIIGKVKTEYEPTDLLDFTYLPEKQFYSVQNGVVIPHVDMFEKKNDPESIHVLPIRFTPYNTPYDINIRDNVSERDRTTMKDHIFVSSSAETPLHPRENLPPIQPDTLADQIYKHISGLLQNQPIWDKRYLFLNIKESYPNEDESSLKTALQIVAPHLCYVMTDGPFRNVWIRFGYNPSKEVGSWIYQYIEFRFSKKPQKINSNDNDPNKSLPELYNIPLNLHNRFPLCVLQTDRDMHQLISQIQPLPFYDKRNGWISMETALSIRNLLKKQAVLLLERNGYDKDTALFTTVKRRIQSSGGNHDSSRRHKDKRVDPSFSGSTEALAKEMPLEIFEEALPSENDAEQDSDEGFEVYGDYDNNVEL